MLAFLHHQAKMARVFSVVLVDENGQYQFCVTADEVSYL
jgi:hypothetical protein